MTRCTILDRLNRVLVLGLSVFACVSCYNQTNDFKYDSTFWHCFSPRFCDYINLKNSYMTPDSVMVSGKTVSSVKADMYLLSMDVTSYTPEMVPELHLSHPGYLCDYLCCGADKEIENAILKNFESLFLSDSKVPKGHSDIYFEYRKEVCKSIRITSDEPLFGKEPGADLSSHFEFFDWWWFDTPSNFIIDSEKNLIGRLSRHLTIEEYLSYNPLMFPNATLRLKDIPQEAPVTVSFSVEIELEKDKVLSSTAPAITLTLE